MNKALYSGEEDYPELHREIYKFYDTKLTNQWDALRQMEADQIQLQNLIDKSAEKVNYEANLVLLAEAQKNLTDY